MATQSPSALITGGAYRIGRAIALDLAGHGFKVIIHANSSLEGAQELADEINASGGTAFALKADLSDLKQAEKLIKNAIDKVGTLDILVNNASLFEPDNMHALDETLWDQHFDVHLKSPVFMSSALAENLGEKHGMIINIIDERVWRLTPNFVSYTLSKSALWTATQTMAQALAPNIRVNAIGPGPTLKNTRQSDEEFEHQQKALILKHGPELDEFGATIRYLWAAKSVTGQMIALDGGQHLAWETPDQKVNE